MKPKCHCFVEGRGVDMINAVAAETSTMFVDVMNVVGVCEKADEFALYTSMIFMMRAICSSRVKNGDIEAERAEFAKMLVGLSDRLAERDLQLRDETAARLAKIERDGSVLQ